jgi:ATP-dependent HslUV protease ATP-binding subunit HslU
MKLLTDEEAGKLVNEDEIAYAMPTLEQNGIVFIDEIDKVASRNDSSGADVSRQGVQRDLLPLVEGTGQHQVRHGQDRPHPVHRLGRLSPGQAQRPDSRTAGPLADPRRARFAVGEDFKAILTQTDASLVRQYQALLATEA